MVHDISRQPTGRVCEMTLIIDGVTYQLRQVPHGIQEAQKPPDSSLVNTFRKSGGVWEVQYAARLVHLPDALGLHYIHHLMRSEGSSIHSSRLLALINGESVNCSSPSMALADDSGLQEAESSCGDELVPADARRRLLTKIESLGEEVECLRASGDSEGAAELEEQIEQIEAYLRRNTYRGRSARFANRSDRDRKSVGIAIRRAIRAMSEMHPALGRHLDNSIRTGSSCSYQPEQPTAWAL